MLLFLHMYAQRFLHNKLYIYRMLQVKWLTYFVEVGRKTHKHGKSCTSLIHKEKLNQHPRSRKILLAVLQERQYDIVTHLLGWCYDWSWRCTVCPHIENNVPIKCQHVFCVLNRSRVRWARRRRQTARQRDLQLTASLCSPPRASSWVKRSVFIKRILTPDRSKLNI